MDTDELLAIARQVIEKVPTCMAITVNGNGEANARVVQPSELSDAWTLWFCTHRGSRKVQEIEQSGKLTLAFQHDPEGAYVTLVGRATINDDVAFKNSFWKPASFRWHPGGPDDPNVVVVDFAADRIELWSSPYGIVPDPLKGLWARVMIREASGWHQSITFPRSQASAKGGSHA